jgi:hypothetical protein
MADVSVSLGRIKALESNRFIYSTLPDFMKLYPEGIKMKIAPYFCYVLAFAVPSSLLIRLVYYVHLPISTCHSLLHYKDLHDSLETA